jgi:calcineurin-like phosphoesterase family protein
MKDSAQLQEQVKAAWQKLPKDMQQRLEPRIREAHDHVERVRRRIVPPGEPSPPKQLVMMHSLLQDDPHGTLMAARAPVAAGIATWVDADGDVYFGGVKYDNTDPGWSYVFVALAETLKQTPPFKVPSAAIQIPDDATIAVLGDWGGDNQSAQQVAAAAQKANADYFIHLGDVYYAGTNGTDVLDPYESTHFLNVWPGPAGRSFALNSNHDMYAHATGYSLTTLCAPNSPFSAQGGANCFALFNSKFRIVGLDSAYYAPDDMYDIGSLGDSAGPQAMFLQQQAEQAASSGQNLIIMTHHNGLSANGAEQEPLWQEVVNQLSAMAGKTVCWYWGHVHVGAVYTPQTTSNGITINPRCCGHSCVPWGLATGLQSPNVLWFEQELLGPGHNYFVTNGYATLALSGASMKETFFSQSGIEHWSDTWPAVAKAAA